MNTSKKALIATLISVAVLGILFIYNKDRLVNIVNLNISNFSKAIVGAPILDWQTYTNTEYGYKIKYPKGYYVDTKLSKPFSQDYEIAKTEFAGDTVISNYPDIEGEDFAPKDYVGIRLGFWKLPTDSHLSLDEYVKWMLAKADGLQRFDLNGNPAARYRTYSNAKSGNHERLVQPTTISIRGDEIVVIGYTYFEGTEDKTTMALADEIIRTFTFIK